MSPVYPTLQEGPSRPPFDGVTVSPSTRKATASGVCRAGWVRSVNRPRGSIHVSSRSSSTTSTGNPGARMNSPWAAAKACRSRWKPVGPKDRPAPLGKAVAEGPEQGRQVPEVIGVEVGDGKMGDPLPTPPKTIHSVEGSGAAVHEEGEAVSLNQVGCRATRIVGEKDSGAQNGDPGRRCHPSAPPAGAATSTSSSRTPTMELTPGSSMVTP